jgi:hypothetical protein
LPTPAPVGIAVVSGLTGEPVGGAHLVVGAVELATDESGRVTTTAGLSTHTLVDVIADGFFDRQTTLGRLGAAGGDTLWPREGPGFLDEAFTQEVIYTTSSVGEERIPGGAALHRWQTAVREIPVLILGSADDARYRDMEGRALDAQSVAVDRINAALGGAVRLLPPAPSGASAPAEAVRVRLMLQRPPGNAFPDNDRTASSAAASPVEFRCR